MKAIILFVTLMLPAALYCQLYFNTNNTIYPGTYNYGFANFYPVTAPVTLSFICTSGEIFSVSAYDATNLTLALQSLNTPSLPVGFNSYPSGIYLNLLGGLPDYLTAFYLNFNDSATFFTNMVFTFLFTPSIIAHDYGFLYYDMNSNFFSWIPGTQNLTLSTISIPLNPLNRGLYIFASYDLTSPIPTLYTQVRTITDDLVTYDYPYGIQISVFATSTSNTFYVLFNSTNPKANNATGKVSLNQFITIDATGTLVGLNASLGFTYTTFMSGFAIGYYNDTDGMWVFPPGTVVDTVNSGVGINTNHFSTWGLYGEPTTSMANKFNFTWVYLIFMTVLFNYIRNTITY